jgi:hypothetical protein
VSPGDGNRCKSPKCVDDANALVWTWFAHFTTMLNAGRCNPVIKHHQGV